MRLDLKERVLETADITEVIGSRVRLKPQGRELVGLCPFHDDRKPSMYVNPSKRIFKCFACGAGGDVIRFVQLFDRSDFRTALHQLAEQYGIDRHETAADRAQHAARDQQRQILEWAAEFFRRQLTSPHGAKIREYARGRGLSDEALAAWRVGFAPDAWSTLLDASRKHGISDQALVDSGLAISGQQGKIYDRFRNRLIFPIRDAQGRVIAFGGRALGDDPAKYLNSPETASFQKSRVLYGFDLARDTIQREHEAIVVEGYLDAILMHQAGLTSAVATLGTALTRQHLKLLGPLVQRVTLVFDGDEAGTRAADRAVSVAIQQHVETRVVVPDPGSDPADYVASGRVDELEALLSSGTEALAFKWSIALSSIDNGTYDSKRAAVDDYLRLIGQVVNAGQLDPVQLGLLAQRVAHVIGLPVDETYKLIADARLRAKSADGVREPAERMSDSDLVDDRTAYERALTDVPRALVPPVELLLGLILDDPRRVEWVDPELSAGLNFCDAWEAVYNNLLHILSESTVDEHGARHGVSKAAVIAACDDDLTLDAIRQCLARVASADSAEQSFRAAASRVKQELAEIRLTERRSRILSAASQSTQAEQFGQLLSESRSQTRFLPRVRSPRPET